MMSHISTSMQDVTTRWCFKNCVILSSTQSHKPKMPVVLASVRMTVLKLKNQMSSTKGSKTREQEHDDVRMLVMIPRRTSQQERQECRRLTVELRTLPFSGLRKRIDEGGSALCKLHNQTKRHRDQLPDTTETEQKNQSHNTGANLEESATTERRGSDKLTARARPAVSFACSPKSRYLVS
jgi:hypothetical protein